MSTKNISKNKYVLAAAGLTLSTITQFAIASNAHAAAFTNLLVRFDRMQVSTPTTGLICATPATTATEAKALFVLPTGYTVSATTANWSVSTAVTTGWPTGATAWIGIGTATAVSGQTVTFPSGDLTVGTQYCFNWTNSNAVTTNSSTGNSQTGTLTTQTSANAQIDQSSYSTSTISSDQIAVTASVPQSFSFALSANTDQLNSLSTASVTSSSPARTATVNTNAKNGWSVWARDATTGLNSPSATYTIGTTTPGTNSTLSAGTEGYNTGVTSSQTAGSGTISVATPFVGGATGKGGGLDTSLRTLATSNGTASGGTLTLTNNVAISAITPAATDYSDTITVVAAGLF